MNGYAASTNLSVVISAPSTSVSCPLAPSFASPVAAGTIICAVTVEPIGGMYVLGLSGTNAASFALSNANLVVGSAPLPAGTYYVTITATP